MKKRQMYENIIASNVENNLKISISNRLREVYNLGYKDGFEDGGAYMLDQLRERVMSDYEEEESDE